MKALQPIGEEIQLTADEAKAWNILYAETMKKIDRAFEQDIWRGSPTVFGTKGEMESDNTKLFHEGGTNSVP